MPASSSLQLSGALRGLCFFLHLAENLALIHLKFNLNNVESSAHPCKKSCGESHEALVFVIVDKPSP